MSYNAQIPTISRRALSLAGVALAAMTAACKDAPSAPSARSLPSVPSASTKPALAANAPIPDAGRGTGPTVTATLEVRREDKVAVGGTFKFSNSNGWSAIISDQYAGDADPRLGYMKVQLPAAASYTAQIGVVHWSASLDSTEAKTVYANSSAVSTSNAPIDFGFFRLKVAPRIDVKLVADGQPLLGQTINVKNEKWYTSWDITDGGMRDTQLDSPAPVDDGNILFYVPTLGVHKICPVTAPASYAASCQLVDVTAYGSLNTVVLHFEKSAF